MPASNGEHLLQDSYVVACILIPAEINPTGPADEKGLRDKTKNVIRNNDNVTIVSPEAKDALGQTQRRHSATNWLCDWQNKKCSFGEMGD